MALICNPNSRDETPYGGHGAYSSRSSVTGRGGESSQESLASGLISRVQVEGESGRLRRVILGRSDTFGTAEKFTINCRTIQRAIDEGRLPPVGELGAEALDVLRARMSREFSNFEALLIKLGVDIMRPAPLKTQEQLFPRDPLIVIGNRIVVSQMKSESRIKEFSAIRQLLDSSKPDLLIHTPSEVFLEGGDVMIHKGVIYVGIGGPRTSSNAVEFLREVFPDMRVVPLELAPADGDADVLHLDCCLNFIGMDDVLIYPEGFKNPALVAAILSSYERIQVPEDEQRHFATNLLSIAPDVIVSRPSTPKTNKELRRRGYTVHEIEFGTVELFGGSFRCATHPLVRDNWAERSNASTLKTGSASLNN